MRITMIRSICNQIKEKINNFEIEINLSNRETQYEGFH
jgi:hypothetical protein